jgi:hypothetical protein
MTRILAAFVAANALASDGDGLTSPDFASRGQLGGQIPRRPSRDGGVALRRCRDRSSRPICGQHGPPVALSAAYQAAARRDAAIQLERAGIRLAALLNRILG